MVVNSLDRSGQWMVLRTNCYTNHDNTTWYRLKQKIRSTSLLNRQVVWSITYIHPIDLSVWKHSLFLIHVMQLILSRNISLWCRKKKARRYQLKGGNDQERKRIKGQHTSQQTEDWATGTPQKIGDGIRCSGKVSSSWSTSGTCYCYETNVMWYGNRVGHHKYK